MSDGSGCGAGGGRIMKTEILSDTVRARATYDTIVSFDWSITWTSENPIPDDAWPIDIIRRAITAAREAGQVDGLRAALSDFDDAYDKWIHR